VLRSFGRTQTASAALRRRAAVSLCAAAWFAIAAHAQQPAPAPDATPPAQSVPAPAPDAAQPPAASAPAPTPADTTAPAPAAQSPSASTTAPSASATDSMPDAAPSAAAPPGGITEEELKQQLVGKQFYLRGGYLGDSITFNEKGHIIGHSPQGSYTLSIIQIDRVHLTKHKVELEGASASTSTSSWPTRTPQPPSTRCASRPKRKSCASPSTARWSSILKRRKSRPHPKTSAKEPRLRPPPLQPCRLGRHLRGQPQRRPHLPAHQTTPPRPSLLRPLKPLRLRQLNPPHQPLGRPLPLPHPQRRQQPPPTPPSPVKPISSRPPSPLLPPPSAPPTPPASPPPPRRPTPTACSSTPSTPSSRPASTTA